MVAFYAGQEPGDAEWTAVMEAIKAVAQEQGRIVSVTKRWNRGVKSAKCPPRCP